MYARPIRCLRLRGRCTLASASFQRSTGSYLLPRQVLNLCPSPSSPLDARAGFYTTPTRWGKVMQKFNLADIGEGITECEIIKWSVTEGARVQAFDPLCEVQSDKASVEITSPFDGIVTKLIVPEGSIAKVGEGLCLIETEEEGTYNAQEAIAGSRSQAAGADVSTSTTSVPPVVEPQQPASPEVKAPALVPRGLHPLDPNYTPPASPAKPLASGVSSTDVLSVPSVRYLARQKGVDLGVLMPGSGKGGRIEKVDVERYLAKGTTIAAEVVVKEERPVDPEQDAVVQLGRTRYGMWKAMTKSLEIPQFGYTTTLDLTAYSKISHELEVHIPRQYRSYKVRSPHKFVDPSAIYPAPFPQRVPPSYRYDRLTFLPFLLKTLSKAMMEWPLFRSSLTPQSASPSPSLPSWQAPKPTLTVRPHADISVALSTRTGLYTPTLSSVDASSMYTLASSLNHLAHLGRQVPCGLTPKEMPRRGGTITVSNVGAIGQAESAMPLLVPGGGVAIVALGRAKWVWDVDDEHYYGYKYKGQRRLKMGVSWSGDHRVVEGAELAAFVECWREYVESPKRLIAESV